MRQTSIEQFTEVLGRLESVVHPGMSLQRFRELRIEAIDRVAQERDIDPNTVFRNLMRLWGYFRDIRGQASADQFDRDMYRALVLRQEE